MAGGMHGGGHVWQGACMAGGCAWWGVCVAGGYTWQLNKFEHASGFGHSSGSRGDVAPVPPPSRYYEIRSMSGRYVPYWNAFLF